MWHAEKIFRFALPRPSLKRQRSVRLTLTGHAAEWKNSGAHNAITARHRPDIIQQVSLSVYLLESELPWCSALSAAPEAAFFH